MRDGVLDGVRVDHPDGLADPAGYLRRLRDADVPHVWVEKILAVGEGLRDWPVDGTVGYEFLVDVGALFVDPAGEAALTDLWQTVSGDARPFEELMIAAQLELATVTFAREVDRLRVLLGDDDAPIPEALAELPVYRTYVEPWSGTVADEDREAIAASGMAPSLAEVLLLQEPGNEDFVTRFQQTSPPVTAKGVEDTAFYRYGRLMALNEVGGEPARFGMSVADFHAANAERARRFPRNLLVTSTHDTKRSADARARIGALPRMPDEWAAVRGWRGLGAARDGARRARALHGPPDARRRLAALRRAARGVRGEVAARGEGAHDVGGARRGLRGGGPRFARRCSTHEAFLADFEAFLERARPVAERHALGQLLLKLTVPGLPDVYGGDDLVVPRLVDPDNRRPVDWAARREALDALRSGAPRRRGEREALAHPARAGPAGAAAGRVRGRLRAARRRRRRGAFLRGDGEVLVAVRVRELPTARGWPCPGRWRSVLDEARRGRARSRAQAWPSSPVQGRWRCSSAREELGGGRRGRRAASAGRRSRRSPRSTRRTGPRAAGGRLPW